MIFFVKLNFVIFRRMCDLLDDPGGIPMPSSRKSSNAEALGLALGKYF